MKRLGVVETVHQPICRRYLSSNNDRIFENLQGVEVMVDDIQVWEANQKEHIERLEKVRQCAKQRNLKLNKEKHTVALVGTR